MRQRQWALTVIVADCKGAEEVLGGRSTGGVRSRASGVLETALRRVRGGYLISAIG